MFCLHIYIYTPIVPIIILAKLHGSMDLCNERASRMGCTMFHHPRLLHKDLCNTKDVHA